MIEERVSDIFEQPDINVIVHGCNCFHTFGAGLAKIIAEKYPESVVADKETKYGDSSKMGKFSAVKAKDGKTIVNLYQQWHYGTDNCKLSYDAFVVGLENLNDTMSKSPRKEKLVLGIPHGIGCGLAGGRWPIVRAAIKDIFKNAMFKVVIVKLPAK